MEIKTKRGARRMRYQRTVKAFDENKFIKDYIKLFASLTQIALNRLQLDGVDQDFDNECSKELRTFAIKSIS
jgi:hypothetical protein